MIAARLAGWSEAPHGTLAQRLAHALRQAIAAGLIGDGSRLPPERVLGSSLAVSRSTVTAALDELRGEGLLVSRRGSGTVVSHPVADHPPGARLAGHFEGRSGIDLLAGNPADASHLPPLTIDVAALLAGGSGPAASPLGLGVLRTALARRHTEQGWPTRSDQIHVTSGAHHAIAVVLGTLAGPGIGVGVEDPGYPGLFDILDELGLAAVSLALDDDGIVPASLDRVLRSGALQVVYLQGGPHNPTGRVSSEARVAELADIFDRHPDVIVVEDRTLADLAYGDGPAPELAPRCRRATVVSVGSFSKVAWAGLRLGWLRAPEPLVERTRLHRLARDLGSSVPSQLLAAELVGHLDGLGARRRAMLEPAAVAARQLLADEIPQWRAQAPQGGSVLWLDTGLLDTDPFVALARHHGVNIAAGSIARADRRPDPHVRICVDRPWSQVELGIRRLADAWGELGVGRRPASGLRRGVV
ncbi:MAG: PLP-dependent aminotransferase family protein [Acidimicrobiales bacterium]|nr:PLP-dependent aminotransferase family protein [Acidimicrobiales bacterium]